MQVSDSKLRTAGSWRCVGLDSLFSLGSDPFLCTRQNSGSPVHARASLLFVEHRVFDSLALSVFASLGGDPSLAVARDHNARREGGLAALPAHHSVGAGVDLRKRHRITIGVVTRHRVILAIELAAASPMLSLALGRHDVDREFYTAVKCFPFGGIALR